MLRYKKSVSHLSTAAYYHAVIARKYMRRQMLAYFGIDEMYIGEKAGGRQQRIA